LLLDDDDDDDDDDDTRSKGLGIFNSATNMYIGCATKQRDPKQLANSLNITLTKIASIKYFVAVSFIETSVSAP
jgi:hypothetical protein